MTNEHLTLAIETRVLGRSANWANVTLNSRRIPVRDLISAKAGQEWTKRGHAAGAEYREPPALNVSLPSRVPGSEEEACRAAVDAFRAGWYIILVDGQQVAGLDVTLSLHPCSQVALVRLYPVPDPA